MFEITASIVLYNTSPSQLRRLLECIAQSAVCHRVYLIDNSPSPTDIPEYHLPWITYLRLDKNLGYGAGHNVALRLILNSSEFHFVLNPDIYFAADELQKMIHRMKAEPRVGQLMPKVIYPDGSLQYLCKLIPTPSDLIFRRFFIGPAKKIAKKRLETFELRFTGHDQEMDVPYLSGCFMLFRTSSLQRIGIFDEQFFMYPEDIDITRRMHSSYRTLFFPGAVIIHDHAKESYKSWRMLWVHITNMIKYFNKWGWVWDKNRQVINRMTLKQFGLPLDSASH